MRVLQELNENCSCPICRETYSSSGKQRPKLLPGCGHSVCEGCANGLCRNMEKVPPCCPLCRAPFEVPRGGASKLPNNVDAIRSLKAISELRQLYCRRHPCSTEDLFCLSCSTLICAKCHVNEHAQHRVTLVEVASENFRGQLDKHIEVVETLKAHLARAEVAVKDLQDRAAAVQRLVLEKERAMTTRIENDTAMLLQQLASRLNPLKQNVEDVQKSLSEEIGHRQAIVNKPRELVRHFPAMQATLERLRELTVDINVDEIERQQVEFRPFALTDWIPLDSVNLVGRLASSFSDLVSDPPTAKELQAQLNAEQKKESLLLTELEEVKEQQKVASNRISEQAMLYKQQETRMAERDNQLCQYIEMLRTGLINLAQSEQILEQKVEIVTTEKTELEKKMAVQEEHLSAASRRISELKVEADELKGQLNASELRQKDLEERLRNETGWRRNAEDESRRRRYQNEDLITQLEEDRQNAERKYEELQDRVATLLKNAKQQARRTVWRAALSRENSINRQAEDKLSAYSDQIQHLTTELEQAQHLEADLRQQLATPLLQTQSLNAQ